jgi:glutamyl-tRNA synthetase
MSNKIIVRFAPSPTGPLHIGGARTALFNWLFAKKNNGKCLLRIEDTDKARSKKEYEQHIEETLEWLEITPDEKAFNQSLNLNKHVEISNTLLANNNAYKCYCTQEELEKEKTTSREKGLPYIYSKKCRYKKEGKGPFVIRFKSNEIGSTDLDDLVQGKITLSNSTIEDFVIIRTDGSPTYQLSASVDDYLMKVTHVIRGDDHKINTFKQTQIFKAMGWAVPQYAHIPLIHSKEGKKLSKRDSATTIEDYKKIGILPESLRNYLLRLGWSYKDKEIFSLKESIELFNLEGIGKSPSKLDMDRILSINETYLKNTDIKKIFEYFVNYSEKFKTSIDTQSLKKIETNFATFVNKAKTLENIYDNCKFVFEYKKIEFDSLISDNEKNLIKYFAKEIEKLTDSDIDKIKPLIDNIVKEKNIKFKDFGQPLRIVLTGSKFAPSINDIIQCLGIEEVYKRISLYL